jgi:hypothetical protein
MGINEEVTNKGKKSFGKGYFGTQRYRVARKGVFWHAKARRRRVGKGVFFSQRHRGASAKAQSLMDVYFSQRHRGARAKTRSLMDVFFLAKTPGCKRGGGKGDFVTQRRKDAELGRVFYSRKGTGVQAQRHRGASAELGKDDERYKNH